MSDVIVGIDLGTTNSEIAAYVDDRVKVLGPGTKILPSCVGFSPTGELLVGAAARNQQLLYPDRTVRSIKRKMGTDETTVLDGKTFTPQDISALILRQLVQWGQEELKQPIRKAIITVPAYFSDAQRNATREAGVLAGLEVVRILNEPTAASLAYGFDEKSHKTVMVYDLGGGTFDVSIVRIENDVTEVLASHGNNHLGGDDFDQLLVDAFVESFKNKYQVDLRDGHAVAMVRLWRAAEEAKIKLSFEPYTTIREENLISVAGTTMHLEMELSRSEYEAMIRPKIESTLDSVSKAMRDAGKQPGDLDAILLVGGSTRTPLIWRILEEKTGIKPRQDIHPDLTVALGAGVLASRTAGQEVDKVLVDVSPFSFGPSFLGDFGGREYPWCYRPIIEKNTPLPVTRTEMYSTSHPYQTEVDIHIFQGDDPDAMKNIPVGRFRIEGLTSMYEPNEILCKMSLDLNGILKVSAIEKRSGKSKHITLSDAFQQKDEKAVAEARERLASLFTSSPFDFDLDSQAADVDDETPEESDYSIVDIDKSSSPSDMAPDTISFEWVQQCDEARTLVEHSRSLLDTVHEDDKEELIDLNERILAAIESQNPDELKTAIGEMKELLFFIEGK